MTRVFASYSRTDKRVVGQLVDFLRLTGDVFLDRDSIAPGEKWEERIQTEIRNADKVAVFWCQHVAASDFVRKEYELAIEHDRPMVPVLMDNTQVPSPLNRYQYLDMRRTLLHGEGGGDRRKFRIVGISPVARRAKLVEDLKAGSAYLSSADKFRELTRRPMTVPQLVSIWRIDTRHILAPWGGVLFESLGTEDFVRSAAQLYLRLVD